MNKPKLSCIDLSAVEEDKFYRFNGEIMSGSQIFTYLEASEPTNPTELLIEPVVELDRELLTGERPQ